MTEAKFTMNDITYKKERFETVLSVDDMMKKYYDYKTTYEKCSRCTGFGLTWSCPDLSFDPRDFWPVSYTHLDVYKRQVLS